MAAVYAEDRGVYIRIQVGAFEVVKDCVRAAREKAVQLAVDGSEPVFTGVRRGSSVVTPSGGFTDDGPVHLINPFLKQLGRSRIRERAIIEKKPVYEIGKSHSILGVSIKLVVDVRRAFADVVASFDCVLSVP